MRWSCVASAIALAALALAPVGCSGDVSGVDPSEGDGGHESAAPDDAGAGSGDSGDDGLCHLVDHTSPTSKVAASGCAVVDRDTSACAQDRAAQGLTGYWLKFSCRVKLSKVSVGGADIERAESDGLPDTRSNYFPASDPCHEDYQGAIQNPNLIAMHALTLQFPLAPNTTMADQRRDGAVVGLVIDAVPIFGNFAAPGDDIFSEAKTFDRCGAHPQQSGIYHHHTEPLSVSNDDDHFIGVLRDGYPVYGRRDADGTLPTLDAFGGHTGVTPDSPTEAVYHYHLNLETSTDPRSAGTQAWFLSTGYYRGLPSTCDGCY